MEKKQRALFDVKPPPWELDDASPAVVVRVALNDPPFGPFDYVVPDAWAAQVAVGMRVEVPLGRGNRTATGYCVDVFLPGQHPDTDRLDFRRLKPIERLVDTVPLISLHLVELARQISDYYICSLASVFETMVPPGVRKKAGTREVDFYSMTPQAIDALSSAKLPPKQRAILSVLAAAEEAMPIGLLCEQAQCTAAPVRALRKRGLLSVSTQRVRTSTPVIPAERREADWTLNPEQASGLAQLEAQIRDGRHATFLIHGITGSGKTEVYIRAIQCALAFGRQAIVLVPEISLTPQTRQRFRARFDRVAVIHSHLSDAERAWHWQEIQHGRVQVVIGARSAISRR